MNHPTPHLFCFGFGYSAKHLAALLPDWRISGSVRSPEHQAILTNRGIQTYLFDDIPAEIIASATHFLHSIPPSAEGDPVYLRYRPALTNAVWFGYLSTTGVYGDHQGSWVDETTPVNPPNDRSRYRADAEKCWLDAHVNAHIFRLSGIYGSGRSALDSVREGTARRIDKPGQVFSRIHVEDIAQILLASVNQPTPGSIYNLADDDPCPQEEVIRYACELLGVEPPPLIPFNQAPLSAMARSFYSSNRRVSNRKIKDELHIKLRYPSYKEGLLACMQDVQAI